MISRAYQPIQREGWLRDGANGEGDENELVVVASDSVGVKLAAASALVDNRPVAASADPDGDGLHGPAALGSAVAGHIVYVLAPEAPGAMVPVSGAQSVLRNRLAAARTVKPVGSGSSVWSAMVVLRMRFRSQRSVLSFLPDCRQAENSASLGRR